jgi:hypothetical protein
MAGKSHILRLSHMIQAMERIRELTTGMDIATFEEDWQKQWLVERGMQIITEATRHLPDDLRLDTLAYPGRIYGGSGTCCAMIMKAWPRGCSGKSSTKISGPRAGLQDRIGG